MRITSALIEIIHKGKRVASHVRSFGLGKCCTLPEHRPVKHQKYLEWTPSRIISWAGEAGPSTGQLATHILEKRPFPEQGYRSCLGLIRMGDRYGKERLESARAVPLMDKTILHMREYMKCYHSTYSDNKDDY